MLKCLILGVILVLITGCNAYSDKMCTGKAAVDLDQYVGPLMLSVFLGSPDYQESGPVLFQKGQLTGSYTLTLGAGTPEAQNLFKDAMTCRIGDQVILEHDTFSDGGENIVQAYLVDVVDGKIRMTSPSFNKSDLLAQGVPFQSLAPNAQYGLAEELIMVENGGFSDVKIISLMTSLSLLKIESL